MVLKCYDRHPRIYKRFGPTTKNGGLDGFLKVAESMKCLIESLLTHYMRSALPTIFPSELVMNILDLSITGKKKLDAGYYSKKQMDKICEGIQRRKFLTLVNSLSITLFNAILCNKTDLGKDSLIQIF